MSKTQIATGGIADDAVTAAKATGFGKIGQVLSTTIGSEQSTTSGTYADVSGLSQAITPVATSSKIFVQASIAGDVRNGSGTSTLGSIKLLRGSTELETKASFIQINIGNGNPDKLAANCYHSFLDSPSSTSALTFKYQFIVDGGTFRIGTGSKITLIEVLA
tara:strand:- start:121 stop:606 length:486 start_codon:yes stop_codon:yes gene_type:complete